MTTYDKSPTLGLNLPKGTDTFDYDVFLRQNFTTIDSSLATKANKFSTFVNILDYSSYKVGSDWANAIQQAVNALTSGGTIYFPAGATYTTSALFPTKVNLNILGDDFNKSIIQYTGSAATGAFIDTSLDALSLRNIQINGNFASNIAQTCDGVYLHAPDSSHPKGGHYFDNVYISNFGGHGFNLGTNVFMCEFKNLKAYSNGKSGLYINGTDCTFSNIHTQGNAQHGIAMMLGNNRLTNFNCIFNGKSGIAYAGYYQNAWNCQVSNGQCQDNFYHGFIFDGATYSTLDNLESDANGYQYTSGNDTNITGYGFVFQNSCKNISGNIQAINYRSAINCISGLNIDSTCANINVKYEELSKYYQQKAIVNTGLVRLDTTADYLYNQYIKSGKTLTNKAVNPNFNVAGGYTTYFCNASMANGILTGVSTSSSGRLQYTDTKTNNGLYYVGLKVRATANDSYNISIFKNDGTAPAYDNIVTQSMKGTGDWQYISFLYYLNNPSADVVYYMTVNYTYNAQSIDIEQPITLNLTNDLGIPFSRTSTQLVFSIDFMDKIINSKGWFATSLTLS